MKELGIYIHIPFCKRKCYYCDFISYTNKGKLIERYINALSNEIEEMKDKINKEYKINTIYIGGGTPSFIDEKNIEKILNKIFENYNVSKKAEITIEVNPGTVTIQKIEKYKEIGINRISIGLQTTNNQILENIGRIHNYEDFLNTYDLLKQAGFDNVNIDLMLGLPNQSLEDLQKSLNRVIELNPKHISVYSLIIEEETPIQKMIEEKRISLPSEEIERKMYWKVKETLEKNQYTHYEISNFSKQGYESKHNLNCWEQKEYIGFGVAAHSYFDNKRFSNTIEIEEYVKNIEEGNIDKNKTINEEQTEEEIRKEYMLLGLRKIRGVDIQEFKNKFVENPIYVFHKELEKLVKEELVEIDLNQIKLTNKGLDFANLVWEEFI